MPKQNVDEYTTAVFDIETDPFERGVTPWPFAAGFHTEHADGSKITLISWGTDCIAEIMQRIAGLTGKYLIYSHTSFDFGYLWAHMQNPFIIDGEVVEFTEPPPPRVTKTGRVFHYKHKAQRIWRDGHRVVPVPMVAFKKATIDYAMFKADRRELPRNRERIVDYLESDLRNQLELMRSFRQRFGGPQQPHLPLTVGQLAMREMLTRHQFDRASDATDQLMRPYYFGGRCETYRGGVIDAGEGQVWKLYDQNSSYAAAMRNFDHPLSDDWEELDRPPIEARTVWFARVHARNRGILPWHDPVKVDYGPRFNVGEGEFYACSHELVPAIEAGQVEVLEWLEVLRPVRHGRFRRFVDDWHGEVAAAQAAGDRAAELFGKAILRAASGKFGQDPRKYRDWIVERSAFAADRLAHAGYTLEKTVNYGGGDDYRELWSKPTPVWKHSYWNVGISASITSAGRAMLSAAVRKAREPVYCDTDSVICRELRAPRHANRLGAWKLQAKGRYLAVAKLKTYCLYDLADDGKVISRHLASAGETLAAEAIIALARQGCGSPIAEPPIFRLLRKTRRNSENAVELPGEKLTV